MSNGVYMVHQRFSPVPTFTVLENLFLIVKRGFTSSLAKLNYEDTELRAKELIKTLGLDIPLNIPMENLSLGIKQRAEILKALVVGANVLISDESTSFLTPYGVKKLFRFIKDLSSRGAWR
jgi:simple sugar transport system ATP-binding protein